LLWEQGKGKKGRGEGRKRGAGLTTVGAKVTWTGGVGGESGRRGELEKRGAQGKEECASWEKIGGERKGVWGERLVSGPHQKERRRRRNRLCAARGGCGGVRLGRMCRPKGGGARG
jgi:hypothetical protein